MLATIEQGRPHSLVYSSDQRGALMLLSPPNLHNYSSSSSSHIPVKTTHSRKLQSFDHLALCVAFAAAITSSMPCAKKTFGSRVAAAVANEGRPRRKKLCLYCSTKLHQKAIRTTLGLSAALLHSSLKKSEICLV